ncbi:MAG: hypothetical protein K2X99_05975 [Gemmatimonadaceae bacterium]|nr:hypothetical protein [Gemmatimonadaceae bacterium]
MLAIPAIDLRDGAVVQLVGGAYDAEKVRERDVGAVVERWIGAGFPLLHIVDLDAATGRGNRGPELFRRRRRAPDDLSR